MEPVWRRTVAALLIRFGVDPRAWRALTGAFLLMDFRGQHYAQATNVRPREVLSPLACVIGQCLVLSGVVAVTLYLRVDVFFYALINISVSMIVIAAAVVVEFNEVVFDTRDMDIIAPRPVTPRTYAAARLANLMAYVLLLWLALNVFPLIVGSGLFDAGAWYAPTYLITSLCADLITAALVILILSRHGESSRVAKWKEILAWTQILLLLIAGYGAQLMFRRGDQALELWAAYPPDWLRYLPSAWLARMVDRAAVSPHPNQLIAAAGLAGITSCVCALTSSRLAQRYAAAQSADAVRQVRRPMPQVGTFASWMTRMVCRNAAERTGFWLARTLLIRDAGLRMRCLYAYNTVVAVVILGLATDQFANPMETQELERVLLPILAVYLTALSVPVAIFNLNYVRDSQAAWCLQTTPAHPPEGVGRGAAKAVQWFINAPLCLLWGLVGGWWWQSPLAAMLHAGLALLLCWPMCLLSLWLVTEGAIFSRDPARGASFGPIALPMAAFGTAGMFLVTAHYFFAGSAWFWCAAGISLLVVPRLVRPYVDRRLRRFWEEGV